MTSQDESGDAARANAEPPQEPIGTERRGICTVKWWRDAKGYGALSCADTAPWDVWCHFSAIQGEGFRTLAPGESVEVEFYRFDQESFKYLARKVRRLSGNAHAPGGC
jgi:CspA family cold shock protein